MAKTPTSTIRNIGPAFEASLTRAGVDCAEMLRDIGAHEAYRRLLLNGSQPHFIPYYLLHMSLQGRPWNDCKGDEKAALRVQFDALRVEVAGTDEKGRSDFEAALDAIGVIDRKRR
nr:TfoX/Sxy family protein [Puniceibacterium sp. IMCC21224]